MENKKKRLLIPLVLVAAVALGLIVWKAFFGTGFLYAGTIEATEVDIPARVSSVISTRDVDEGQHVQTGQLLMRLACEDYKIAADIANENFARAEKLYREGSQSKEVYDQTKNRKDDADLRVTWCTILSPLNGVVLNKYHEPSEWVNPGTRLFTLASLQEVWAYIYVPQPKIAKLSLGQKLIGYLPESKMREFEGSITRISDTAEFTPKNVQTREERTRLVFAVKVTFKNADETLKPGMTIEVKLPE